MDKDVQFDDLAATAITDASGYFNVHFANQPIENGRDIYLKVYCGNDETMVYDFGSYNFASNIAEPLVSYNIEPYYFTTNITTDILYGYYNLEGHSDNGSLISKSFSIGNALYYGREYEKNINGGDTLNDVVVKLYYPLPFLPTSFTLPILDRGCILLTENKYSDWGTILHEYGHAVEDKLEIFIGYEEIFSKKFFTHLSDRNLIDYYDGDKEKALKISWNEGWASYYSICAQRKYSLETLGYPGASHTTIFDGDIVNDAFYGEDNELAIAAAITNVVVKNIVTEEKLWELVKDNQPTSFHELNELVFDEIMASATTTSLPISTLNKYLSILEKQNISAKTLSTNVRYGLSSFSPTLSWTAPVTSPNNENGFVFNYQYSVAIVSVNPAYVYISPAISSTSFTIPTDVWVDIIENCTNGFYWTIITDEVTDPTSGGYYSKFYSMKYQPKELDIPSRNRYTEDRAYVSSGKCYDYRVTFRAGGNKVVQTFGLKDTVLELYSSDGTLLLGRVDTDDKGYEWNSLFSYNFTSNTEYIIRVRFYATNVSGAVKLAIVPTYSHADYNSAYGTYSITTVNWKLGIDKVALFRYKFATAGDVTFTMSAQKDTYLYVLDPSSTELITEYDGSNSDATNLYDDDSGGDLQAQLTKTVEADIEYLVIISFYNPHTSSGDFSINTRYAS